MLINQRGKDARVALLRNPLTASPHYNAIVTEIQRASYTREKKSPTKYFKSPTKNNLKKKISPGSCAISRGDIHLHTPSARARWPHQHSSVRTSRRAQFPDYFPAPLCRALLERVLTRRAHYSPRSTLTILSRFPGSLAFLSLFVGSTGYFCTSYVLYLINTVVMV